MFNYLSPTTKRFSNQRSQNNSNGVHSISPNRQLDSQNGLNHLGGQRQKNVNFVIKPNQQSTNPFQRTHFADSKIHVGGTSDNPNEILSHGLRVLNVPIRRVRGLAVTLSKLPDFNYLFETIGILTVSTDSSDAYHGFSFQLEEVNTRSRSLTLKCQYCDVDGIHPEIIFDHIYRCVGHFSTHKGIFQCYSLNACEDSDLQLLEIFQMHSDNVISQVLSRII